MPRTLPEPQKSMKNHWFSWVFGYFTFCSRWKKIFQNASRKLPRLPQTPLKISQDGLKWLQDVPKLPQDASETPSGIPGRTQGTPQTRPRRAKTAQDTSGLPKNASKTSLKLDFWWFGDSKINIFDWYSQALIHPSLYASKPLVSCRPRRGSRSVYNFFSSDVAGHFRIRF